MKYADDSHNSKGHKTHARVYDLTHTNTYLYVDDASIKKRHAIYQQYCDKLWSL